MKSLLTGCISVWYRNCSSHRGEWCRWHRTLDAVSPSSRTFTADGNYGRPAASARTTDTQHTDYPTLLPSGRRYRNLTACTKTQFLPSDCQASQFDTNSHLHLFSNIYQMFNTVVISCPIFMSHLGLRILKFIVHTHTYLLSHSSFHLCIIITALFNCELTCM